jgi:hypothetical protein
VHFVTTGSLGDFACAAWSEFSTFFDFPIELIKEILEYPFGRSNGPPKQAIEY